MNMEKKIVVTIYFVHNKKKIAKELNKLNWILYVESVCYCMYSKKKVHKWAL